jgi:DNA-binding transcriptional ArsR family regulator
VLHALSDPARLAIVHKLGSGCECSCGGFNLEVAKPTLSHHLRVLREAGLTQTRCDGRHRWVSLRRDDVEARFPGLLGAVMNSSDQTGPGRMAAGEPEPLPDGAA